MEEIVKNSFLDLQGLNSKKRKLWVVNKRVADKSHSSAIHTSKQIIVTNRGDQNTLRFIRKCA